MKVLLLEPDTKLAAIYQTALESAGHQVRSVSNAQTAILQSDKVVPDVVVLELQLARHNGIEFIYEFRSYTEWQHIPLILLTMVPPHALQITPELLEACNIVECLYKPASNLKHLITAIEESV